MKTHLTLIMVLFLAIPFCSSSQDFKVLHYSETSGYDHGTRNNSYTMFQEIGQNHGFTVDHDQTGKKFNSIDSLQQYEVVVFANTSGDAILNATQRDNFEAYMQSGGALIGIHAGSDTYRHSTANGGNTGTWDWYAETLGASVQRSPSHTSANYNGTMDTIGNHATTDNVPDPWQKVEEYYYWENGYYNPANNVVLKARSTGQQSYDAARPISWYRYPSKGGKVFYTALGHANSNYTNNMNFRNHIRDAVLWAVDNHTFANEANTSSSFKVYPNPASKELHVQIPDALSKGTITYRILDVEGKMRVIGKWQEGLHQSQLNLADLETGRFYLELANQTKGHSYTASFIVQ